MPKLSSALISPQKSGIGHPPASGAQSDFDECYTVLVDSRFQVLSIAPLPDNVTWVPDARLDLRLAINRTSAGEMSSGARSFFDCLRW